jgi:hypothetical protein
MAFEKILKGLLLHPGVEGVIFLDSEGESIFCFGMTGLERLKAMGAYQGIVLSSALRCNTGNSGTVITCCESRSIMTRQLKDGYFVCVLLSRGANLAHANFVFQDYFIELEKQL